VIQFMAATAYGIRATEQLPAEESMAEPQLHRMTADEFFAWQAKQDKLYELVDGVPVLPLKMMTGASRAHDRVVVNIIASLHRQLRAGACRPTTDDLALRIPAGNVRRPDVMVECAEGNSRDMSVVEPRVVVEVLSPSTMSFDRIRKLPEYQTVPSVAYILLVDTEKPRIDVWSRHQGGWQQMQDDGLEAKIDLSAINATLDLADVFEGLSLDT
jgi:Uma2 family endonuclease